MGDKKLIWVGTRGHDAIGLMDIPQFAEVYAIVAPLGSLSLEVDIALEELTQKRVDLDTYTIDEDWSPEANELRRRLLGSLTEPTCVVSYRSLALLSAICYPRSEFVTYLGMFHERQATFEHKPWVESELLKTGLPIIPWRYFADDDRQRLEEELRVEGQLVLRSNRSDGGAGLGIVRCPGELRTRFPKGGDGFLAATPLLEPHVPLNVNACVFPSGEITLHPASIQLIGIEGCTRRRFGYCGNDFAAIRSLDNAHLNRLEEVTRKTGSWLHSQGYVGAFGVDAIVHNGSVLLTEVNPRFQGSTSLAARLDREMDRADVMLCHIGAMLGLSPPADTHRSFADQILEQPRYAQIVLHNCDPVEVRAIEPSLENVGLAVEVQPSAGVAVAPDAITFRAVGGFAVTEDGSTIEPRIARALNIPIRSLERVSLSGGLKCNQ